MRLDLGCGYRKLPGWVGVDKASECTPAVVHDLEVTPWPWDEGEIGEMRANHSLEHMGANPGTFRRIMQEAWRVMKTGALWHITFPDIRHDNFWSDPTHVRPLTVQLFTLFDRVQCQQWIALGCANTPLSMYWGINFSLHNPQAVLGEPWKHRDPPPSDAELQYAITTQNNVVEEWRLDLRKEPLQ